MNSIAIFVFSHFRERRVGLEEKVEDYGRVSIYVNKVPVTRL